MTSAAYGKVKPFNPAVDEWDIYQEKLQFYFAANGITDAAKKKSILLTVCGDSTYKLLRSLVPDGKLDAEAVTFASLVDLLKDHYSKKQSTIVHRYNFNMRCRKHGESIAQYVAALRELALPCKYATKEILEEMIRDRFVCGVNHQGIRRKLLSETDLTYESAIKIVQTIEASERDSKQLGAGADFKQDVHYTPSDRSKGNITCYRCGGPHLATRCKHREMVCLYCKKKGHLITVCLAKARQDKNPPPHSTPPKEQSSKPKPTKSANNYVEDPPTPSSPLSDTEYDMNTFDNQRSEPYRLNMQLNDVPVTMELDTGAAVSIISESVYNEIRKRSSVSPLQPSSSKLRTYTGDEIQVLGITKIKVRFDNTVVNVSVHVVKGSGPSLVGRDWLPYLNVDLKGINVVVPEAENEALQEILEMYSSVFNEELGCLKGTTVKLNVNPDAQPKFYKARTVPLVHREKVEKQYAELQRQGIISPVTFSQWAVPVVPVLKKNGKIRICGDYKLNVNQDAPADTYPLPLIDEIFANLSGGTLFSKLDLADAFHQLPLDEESKKFTTISTHKGLYHYNRLPFGVTSAPSTFQRHIDSVLQNMKHVSAYIDDIIVTGVSMEEHLKNLEEVLRRLGAAGLRLRRDKCFFLRPKIEYLGHVIDKDGLHPIESKVQAIKDAPQPSNITQLRSFLGLINYYGKFLPNLSSTLTPLYSLLNKDQKWHWDEKQQQAFQAAKDALQSDALLVHFDPKKPIVLACDASDYGIGAVLSHVVEKDRERPIHYISRTLSAAEKHYSQLEKEALAIVFAVKKFHRYLLGRHFTIESDHQPLKSLFGETNRIPHMASSRIQRWALILSAYKYSIRYKPGKQLRNADALSRLPLPKTTTHDCIPEDVVMVINHLSSTSVSAASIKEWTAKDPVMSCVLRFLLTGWPNQKLDKDFQPFSARKNELSVIDGCILWASRIVVPPPGQKLLLEELHEAHPGISKMKALARSYVWWPGIDSEIEQLVKSCPVCQETRPSPAPAPLHSWEWPSQPWSRIHLDFAGPLHGHHYLVLVDAHSKWLDVHMMNSITSSKTIETLRIIFANHGLPRKVVTDNGPSFTSAEFRAFLSDNGIVHVTTSPYHPSSNGLAERGVQTFKNGLKRTQGATIQERISKFHFSYRLTPHTTTGVAPAQLLMGRRPRSRLDRLFPDLSQRVEKQQSKQAEQHDTKQPLRTFEVGDSVYVQDFSTPKNSWIPGTVTKVAGPLSYHVEVQSGKVVRRHVDAVRKRTAYYPPPEEGDASSCTEDLYLPDSAAPPPPAPPPAPNPLPVIPHPPQVPPVLPLPTQRRSARHRPPPIRYGWT